MYNVRCLCFSPTVYILYNGQRHTCSTCSNPKVNYLGTSKVNLSSNQNNFFITELRPPVTENTNVRNECTVGYSLRLCFTISTQSSTSWTHVFMV